jgi:hypothetical protein
MYIAEEIDSRSRGGISVPSFYTHQDNTRNLLSCRRDMASTMVFCGTCKVPLSGRDQFLGHHMISHELRKEDAESAWQKSSNDEFNRRGQQS